MKRDYRFNLKAVITYPSIWEKIAFILLLILIFGNFLCGMDSIKRQNTTVSKHTSAVSQSYTPLFFSPDKKKLHEQSSHYIYFYGKK